MKNINKKIIFFVLLLISMFSLNAKSIQSIVNESNCTICIDIQTVDDTYISSVYYKKGFEIPEFGYEGSGFKTIGQNYFEDNEKIIFDFIDIFVGHENSKSNDNREILSYRIQIEKNKILERLDTNKSFNLIQIVLDYSPLKILLSDSKNTIMKKNIFYSKNQVPLKEECNLSSNTLLEMNNDKSFDILDVVCSEESKDDIWLKIKYQDKEGYIPLRMLADNWTVVKNNLDKVMENGKGVAVCNDNHVRVRFEPNLDGEILCAINKGDKLRIICHSEKKQVIGTESWYWCKVETEKNIIGWVYGKYLDIE